jgi:protein tyrosine/serine phosphatase
MKKINRFPILAFLILSCAVTAGASEDLAPSVPIKAFEPVSPGIFRGARPDSAALAVLQGMGVRTDLDLEDDDSVIASETAAADGLGIKMISMPMSGFWTPDDQEVTQILSIIADPAQYPIFVHCQHGQDRTGLVIALYRVFYQHWSPQDAHDEMLTLGFHRELVFLNHYFEIKTGFED